MLYNNPVGYHTDVTPEMFVELADIPNLLAIKESSANTRRITELRNLVGDRYRIFTGVDDLFLESAILGIDGWVCGSGIAFPKENQQLWDLAQAGRWDECRALYRWSQPLMKLDTHIHFRSIHQAALPGDRSRQRVGARATPAPRRRRA
jgi:1-pyrroline-4-hydroxy-2-carboxylate deaminase